MKENQNFDFSDFYFPFSFYIVLCIKNKLKMNRIDINKADFNINRDS